MATRLPLVIISGVTQELPSGDVVGVTSVNTITGNVTLKTINGNVLTGTGNMNISGGIDLATLHTLTLGTY
jgi:hypothetical protein